MVQPYSRRSFLVGVLTCGSITASATYLLSAPGPPITLRIGSGSDDSGGRETLIRQWNVAHPEAQAAIVPYGSSTSDQRVELQNAARDHTVDIVNLDVIDVPAFAEEGLIEPIDVPHNRAYLSKPLQTCQWQGRDYAVPFNSDVGVLFRRGPGGTTEPRLAEFLTERNPGTLLMQLSPANSASYEAFVVNVLELVATLDSGLLREEDGLLSQLPPDEALIRWRTVLNTIRNSLTAERLIAADTEDSATDRFNEGEADYLRNWPTAWPALEAYRRDKAPADQLDVLALPQGMLGGQNLALVAGGPHRDQAWRLIEFLTGPESQKVLAMHGFVPTHRRAYDDNVGVVRAVPHLGLLRDLVEGARLRPIHPGYRAFADVMVRHALPALRDGRPVEREFIDAMHRELS
ncbi:extracellular solute-binding protein [Catenuloplanes atrovinosus]|uniref:Multiple sugar transport system substrate-binding protein n=1 Tax=Catenuloplanes atrovinosus TaxID=137266 RepID=A0AAE3YSR0_9ACTN|nr:extracellular solute-binding protein [Catenuloplanes atrovinosus]MDR7277922.1 multiple sugar transport system substrate-binding protein [Catenuloplanes atrovinosus]